MSFELILGAAMVAVSVPLGWITLCPPRGGRALALNRGLTTSPAFLSARQRTLADPIADRVIAPVVRALARRSRVLTPAGLLDGLEAKLAAAALQGRWSIERLLAAKLTLGIVGLLVGLARLLAGPSLGGILVAFVLVAGAWYLPDFLVSKRADARRAEIQGALPDVMDQLTIAVEAGLGFEAGLARVARTGTNALAEELRRTLQDVQLGIDRSTALDALGERTSVADLRRFVSAIRQAERYGLPIANVLRVQSAELRDRRRQRAEEHAMKIPVKILFPLVCCILPVLFIVVIGPGAIKIVEGGLAG